MAITLARGLAATDIRCPDCGNVRTVDRRHARRWREGHDHGTCISCRGGSNVRVARDRDIAYWLRLYGVPVPRGVKARDVITASGVPPDLARFAREVFPP